ncbi:hypothetical protein TIMEGRIFFIN_112 [Bacillus phage vB_BspH_TimeGriffin]|nr:hypothetical protein TIMEGRIFFIN_112 [Bacillus phage vB_BspH_TimeGriffin]
MTKRITINKEGTHMNTVKLYGYNGEVVFDRDWLENKIQPQTLEEFLSEYTYDDTENLVNLRERELL